MRRSSRLQKKEKDEEKQKLIRKMLLGEGISSSSNSTYDSLSTSSNDYLGKPMFEIIDKKHPPKKRFEQENFDFGGEIITKKTERGKECLKKRQPRSTELTLQVKSPIKEEITEIPKKIEVSSNRSPVRKSLKRNTLKLMLEERDMQLEQEKPRKSRKTDADNTKSKEIVERQNTRHVKTMIQPRTEIANALFDVPSSESSEPFTRDTQPIEFMQSDIMQMYLFNIYEEGNKLFLFGKYNADPTQHGTICVLLSNPLRYLQFLPANGKTELLETELKDIFGSSLVEMEIISKSDFNDKEPKEWIECAINPSYDISNFPLQGHNYTSVKGISATLAENFLLKRKIKGCRWINIQCSQSFKKHTFIPFFICKSPENISVEEETEVEKPSMNICIFSMYKRDYECGQQIYMISTRILFQWNFIKFSEYDGLKAGHKVITFILSQGERNCPKKTSPTTIYCETEKDLLIQFFNVIEHYDIDILCSYDLIDKDLPLILSRSKNISEATLVGRFYRESVPGNIFSACAGRVLFDVKNFYKNILSINSSSLASLVCEETGVRLPIINEAYMFNNLNQPYQWNNLIGYSRKETSLIQRLFEMRSVLMICFTISRITNSQLQTIMQGDFIRVIEDQLSLAFFRTGFVIPDRYKKDLVSPLQSASFLNDASTFKAGQTPGYIIMFECNKFFTSLVRENNICFTTVHNEKRKGIVPALFKEYVTTIDKINKKIAGNEGDEENKEIMTNIAVLKIIINIFEKFFIVGSRRFDITEVRDNIRNKASEFIDIVSNNMGTDNDPCILWSDQNRFIVSSTLLDKDDVYLKATSFITSFNKAHRKMKLEINSILKRPLIINQLSFVSLDEEKNLMTEKVGATMKFRSDWTNIECSLAEKLIVAALKADSISNALIKTKSEIAKAMDMLKKEGIKNAAREDFAISFFTWKKSNQSKEVQEYIKEMKTKGLIDIIEDKVSLCICRGGIPKLPSNIKDINMLDIAFYKKRILDVVGDTMDLFPDVLSDLRTAKLAPQKDNNLFVICQFCFTRVPYVKMSSENKCPLCGSVMNWKYVANSLVASIRSIVSDYFANGNRCSAYMCKCSTLQIPLQGECEHHDPCGEIKCCKGRLDTTINNMNPYQMFIELLAVFRSHVPVHEELREYMVDYIKRISSLYGVNLDNSYDSETSTQCSSMQKSAEDSQLDICSFLF